MATARSVGEARAKSARPCSPTRRRFTRIAQAGTGMRGRLVELAGGDTHRASGSYSRGEAYGALLLSSCGPRVVRAALGTPTDAQSRGWAEIALGKDTLICAPTGPGKTLAAFLASLDASCSEANDAAPRRRDRGRLRVAAQGALSSDVQRNLEVPLAGHPRRGARPRPRRCREIRTALRTGDTTPAARAAIVRSSRRTSSSRRPSRSTSCSPRERAARAPRGRVRTVIVDELHALMRDKRGSHLALSLARLDALARAQAAADRPLGHGAPDRGGRALPRRRAGAAVRHRRRRPPARPRPRRSRSRRRTSRRSPTNEQWGEIYDRLAALVARAPDDARLRQHAPHGRAGRAPPRASASARSASAAHHGSLAEGAAPRARAAPQGGRDARARRHRVARARHRRRHGRPRLPDRLAAGGDDASSSASAARGTRSGARRAGRLFATSRDELVECAALVRGRRDAATLDRVEPPRGAARRARPADRRRVRGARVGGGRALRARPRRAAPFARPRRAHAFDEVVASSPRGRRRASDARGALLHRDRVNGRAPRAARARGSSRSPTAAPSPTSPTTASCSTRTRRSSAPSTRTGPSRAWRATSSSSARTRGASAASSRARGVVRVEDARGQPPTVPFWLGEAPARTWELSVEVSRLRAGHRGAKLDGARGRQAPWLSRGVRALARRRRAARRVTSARSATRSASCPTVDDVVFERFFDEAGGMQLVVHAPFGGAREPRASASRSGSASASSFDFELQAAATDDAIVLSLGTAHSFPLTDAFRFVRAEHAATRRWSRPSSPRRCSARAGAGTRRARSRSSAYERGKKVPAVPPADARRGPARGGVSRAGGVPGERDRPASRSPTIRSSAQTVTTASSRRWTPRGSAASSSAWSAARFASTRATRPSRPRSRTRSSTRSPTRSSTTRRSKSAAPAPCRCAGRCPSTSGPRRARRGRDRRASSRKRSPRRATRMSYTTRCSVGSPRASRTPGPTGSPSSRAPDVQRVSRRPRAPSGSRRSTPAPSPCSIRARR